MSIEDIRMYNEKFKIVKILNRDGTEKEDDVSQKRIGRVVKMKNFYPGDRAFMECIFPSFMKSIITSEVQSFKYDASGLRFTTTNSIYILERVI